MAREEIERRLLRREMKARERVRRCREVIQEYLPPDSGISPNTALDRIIGILDGPDLDDAARRNGRDPD